MGLLGGPTNWDEDEAFRPPTAKEYWLVKIRFIGFDDQGRQQPQVITLRAEDKMGLTFLQIASLKLQASILETIPVARESDLR
jgi:hypothetical protein